MNFEALTNITILNKCTKIICSYCILLQDKCHCNIILVFVHSRGCICVIATLLPKQCIIY